jgi:hypothetical protein
MNTEGSVPPAFRQMFLVLQVGLNITPWNIVLLGKLIAAHIIKKVIVLYGTRMVVTVFIRAATGSY